MNYDTPTGAGLNWDLNYGPLTIRSGARVAAFVSTWNTAEAGTSNSQQITLPLEATGNYNFKADWGDGTSDQITVYNDGAITHTYNVSGNYTVTITGTIQGWRFNNGGDKAKLSDITQWGCLQFGNSGGYFYGCSNLTGTATDKPSLRDTTNMAYIFYGCTTFNQDVGSWNTANTTNMAYTFFGCTVFDQDVGSWNTVNVTNMYATFYGCATFNQDVGSWNTANTTNTYAAFYGCTVFDQDVGGWNTVNVTNMAYMFRDCIAFDQDVGSWNTANTTNMEYTFYGCTVFDQDVGGWNVESLTAADNMFLSCTLATANYDSLLTSWAAQTVQSGVNFHGGNSQYSAGAAAAAARASLETDGWTITDGGQAP